METKYICKVVLITVFSFICQCCYGEEIWNDLDFFRSPEALAFQKYSMKNVNEYTGRADINIPIYDVKYKNIDIPLSLTYDSQGIKVSQEASWVGLGWNLMIGGCINMVVVGKVDQNPYVRTSIPYQTPDSVWMERLSDYNYHYTPETKDDWVTKTPFERAFSTMENQRGEYMDNICYDIDLGLGEQDYFSVNLLGRSFCFFVDPFTGKYHEIGKVDEEFKVEKSTQYYENWIITDSNGIQYEFSQGETVFDGSNMYVTSWFLSSITTQTGEEIKFNYSEDFWQSERLNRIEQFDYVTASGNPVLELPKYPHHNEYYTSYGRPSITITRFLESIVTEDQEIRFYTTEAKEFEHGRLDSVIVFDRILGSRIKKINFEYGIFNQSNIGGSWSSSGVTQKTPTRLKLCSIGECAENEKEIRTIFEYNDLRLPSKTSCAQDYWGYYNGHENRIGSDYRGDTKFETNTMLPQFDDTHFRELIPQSTKAELMKYARANRNCDGTYMQAGILQKIKFPTGGYACFEYEPNTYEWTGEKIISDTSVVASIMTSYDQYSGFDLSQQVKTFVLTDTSLILLNVSAQGQFGYMNEKALMVTLFSLDGSDVYKFEMEFSESYQKDYVNLIPPGRYGISIGKPTYIDLVQRGFCFRATLSSISKQSIYGTWEQPAGGLRIKRISDYDSEHILLETTEYQYRGGTLMKMPHSIQVLTKYSFSYLSNKIDKTKYYVTRLGTGYYNLPTFFMSNTSEIGYSEVSKIEKDINNQVHRKIVSRYKNNKPQTMFGSIDYFDYFDNGSLLSQTIYDVGNRSTRSIENIYNNRRITYSCNIKNEDRYLKIELGTIDPVVATLEICMDRFQMWRYPYISSRTQLVNSVTRDCSEDGKVLEKFENYTYNDINNKISSRTVSTSIPGEYTRTRYIYTATDTLPGSSTSRISGQMVTQNHMLNHIVLESSYLVRNGVEIPVNQKQTEYKRFDRLYYLPVSVQTSIGTASLQTRFVYDYDKKYNIRAVTKDGLENVVYLWSYRGIYPVAKIDGLTYSQVSSVLTESFITALSAKVAPTTQDLDDVRTKIEKAGGLVSTYTYKPLYGIETQTLPNGVSYVYEYDSFGRLSKVKDGKGHIISSSNYQYKNNENE